jgi:hypothetical protein
MGVRVGWRRASLAVCALLADLLLVVLRLLFLLLRLLPIVLLPLHFPDEVRPSHSHHLPVHVLRLTDPTADDAAGQPRGGGGSPSARGLAPLLQERADHPADVAHHARVILLLNTARAPVPLHQRLQPHTSLLPRKTQQRNAQRREVDEPSTHTGDTH